MRRITALTLIAFLSLVVSSVSIGINSAQAAVTRLPIVLLVQRSYYVSEPEGCRIDVDNQQQVLLKINNPEGQRRGGAWFTKGETINATGPSGVGQMYCAFVKTAEVETTGEAELWLHNEYLTTVNLNEYVPDTHMVLEVDDNGLIAEAVATPSEVMAIGLEPQESEGTAAGEANPADRGITRTTRSTGVTRTTRSVETPTSRTQNESETSRERTTRTNSPTTTTTTSARTSQRSDIISGEWELQGDSEWDFFFVTISEDWNDTGPEIVEDPDPLDFAVEMGVPLIGEGQAPEGCRVFAFSGPLGIPLFLGACADGEFFLFAYGTDKDLLDDAMEDFSNGDPFRIPYGYFEV